MDNKLAGLRRPIAAAAVALLVVAGSIGAASFAFAQEDGTSTPTIEEQASPTVQPTAQVDDGSAATDDGAAADDGTTDDGTTDDGATDDGSGKPECDGDMMPRGGTSTDATADAAGLTF